MKNFKRILALVLAVVMVTGISASLSAADAWYQDAVTYLENTGIATIGTMADEKITRNEFVLWVAKLETRQLDDSAWNDEIANTTFTDVTAEHHRAAIAYSQRRGFIIGNGDGTFSPDKIISLAEACAVIVRLMGYENKVTDTSDEGWALNYMQVAATDCNAMDEVFYQHTATFNPDYELTYGEAAYLLATIMNFEKDPTDSDYSLTSDGINLGEYFEENPGVGKTSRSYYVAKMDRVSNGLSMAYLIHAGGQRVERWTNLIDTAKDVVLISTDGTSTITVPGADFLKLLRVSLGLTPEKQDDPANEVYEDEINAYQYVDVGSMVNVVRDNSTGEVTSLTVSGNSVIVDTYLQATSAQLGQAYGDNSNGASASTNMIISADDLSKFVGWTFREIGTAENTVPVLPLSYDATNDVTSWTNVVKDANGTITSAVLNFRGETYQVADTGTDEIEIMKISADEDGKVTKTPLTTHEAVKQLINAAQGECFVIFNDVDGDGRFDSAFIKESAPFYFTGAMNVQGSTTNKYDYYSSVSDGKVVGNAQMKGNAIGTIFYNKTVSFYSGASSSAVADYRTDGYHLNNSTTNKLQIVLRPSNMHLLIDGYTSSYGSASPHYYAVADIASFNTGIIENIDAFALDDYYIATIKSTDSEGNATTQQVYIPVSIPDTTTLPITVAGATAEYTFDSSSWGVFLDEARQTLIEEGIVSGVTDPGYKSATAAWMAGKYVQFVTDAQNRVVFIVGTDSNTGTSGFVTDVEKTETGDNTYNVTIATSGTGTVSDEAYYLEAAMDTTSGEYRITTEYTLGGSSSVRPTVGKLHMLNTSGIWYFQDAGGNKWMDYGYNQSRRLIQAESSNSPHATTVGLLNEAINSDIYNATANRSQNKVAAWTVDANGIVHDATGAAVAYQYVATVRGGVGGVATYEVRASASSIFDWENYKVYNAIFSGKLGDPNGMADGKVNPGKDLIYVTVMSDAGSLDYLVYGDKNTYPSTSYGRYGTSAYYEVEASGSGTNLMRLWASRISIFSATPQNAWLDVDGEYIIDIEEIAGSRVVAGDGSSYTASYKATVGFGPYYDRTLTSDGYEYVLRFTEIVEYTDVEGTATAIVDKAQTLMIPLYKGETGTQSTQVQAVTEEDFAKYTIANGYYIDDVTHLVYVLYGKDGNYEVTYKTDANGNIVYSDVVYNWENGTGTTVGTNVSFDTYDVDRYATLTWTEKDRDEEGWFPGASYVTLDGTTYEAMSTTPVVIVTPSEDGFDITTTTLANIPEAGLFVTTWNAVDNYGTLSAIAIVGGTTGADVTVAPTDDSTVVYLDASSKAIVSASEFSPSWLVISDKSAYALPTGEDVGVIYREYSTYAEAVKAASIDLSIVGGHWYKVDEDGRIVEDMTTAVYEELDGIVIDTDKYATSSEGLYSSNFALGTDGKYYLAAPAYTNGVLTGITLGAEFIPTIEDLSTLTSTTYTIPAVSNIKIFETLSGAFEFYKNADGKYVQITRTGETLTEGAEVTVANLAWGIDNPESGKDVSGYKDTYTVQSSAKEQLIYKYAGATADLDVYFVNEVEAGADKYYEVELTATAEDGTVLMAYVMEGSAKKEFNPISVPGFKITSATYKVVEVETITVYTIGGVSFIDETPSVPSDNSYTVVTVTEIADAPAGTPNATITTGAAATVDALMAGVGEDDLLFVEALDTPATKNVQVYKFYEDLFILKTAGATWDKSTYASVELIDFAFEGKNYKYIAEGEAYTPKTDPEGGEKVTATVIASTEDVVVYTEAVKRAEDGTYSFVKTDGSAVSGAPTIAYNIQDFTGVNGGYTDGTNYLVLVGDTYYPADSNYRRIETSSTISGMKTGVITSATASGTTYATIDGVKNVDVTNYNFEFFYKNGDGTVLYKAGDSTNVTVASRAIYEAQIKTQQDAYDKAVAAYEEALAKGYLSDERLAYYKEAVDEAEAALLEAKNSLLDRYFNGRFWCVPNSPYYTYVELGQGTFQQPSSTVTFNYIVIDGTYCVFSDEFVLG